MNYIEENFYKKDKREYDIKNNRKFLNWLINSFDDGARLDFGFHVEDFEELIDYVVSWYELKYPGYILKPYHGNPMADKLRDVPDISKHLDGKQFLYRLSYRQRLLMEPDFCGNFGSSGYNTMENGKTVKKIGLYTVLKGMKGNKESSYLINFDSQSGIVVDSNVTEFKGFSLEELVSYLQENESSIDYSVLENALKNYYFRVELRHRLLQLAALKILYKSESKDMGFQTPDMGYMRAKNFINEFNEDFGLVLSSEEIDKLYFEFAKEDEAKVYKKN